MANDPQTAQDKWMSHPAIGVDVSTRRPRNSEGSRARGTPANASGATEAEDQQRRYEEVLAQLEPKYKALRGPQNRSLAALKQALDSAYAEMKTAEEKGDYAKALSKSSGLAANMADYSRASAEFDERKRTFDSDLKAFQPSLSEASTSQAWDEQAAQKEILALQQKLDRAVAEADFGLAQKVLGELKAKVGALLAARRDKADGKAADAGAARRKQQQQDYERSIGRLKSRMPTATGSTGGRIGELQEGMQTSLTKAEAAAAAQDYEAALGHLKTVHQQQEEFERLNGARLKYEAKRTQIDGHLPGSGKKDSGAVVDLLKKIDSQRAKAEAKARTGDYEGALKDLGDVVLLVAKYQDLVTSGEHFRKRWAEVRPRVPTTTPGESSPGMVKVTEAIIRSRAAIEAAEARGDYEKGMFEIEHMASLLAALDQAKQKGAQARANFEAAYALLKRDIEAALASEPVVKEVKAKQADLAAKRKALDGAIARNDFEAAQAQLPAVQSALDMLLEERRKSPINKNTVRDMAGRLSTAINRMYMTSQAKVNNAATAYDAALGKHKAAIAKVDAKKQLAADVAAGVFFAALGGFVGGAVGSAVKGPIEKAFQSKAAAGGIIDATKDVAKYLTKTTEKLRGKISDPTAISAKIGGNGTELARGIGAAVNEQGAKLLETVEQWYTILLESDKTSPMDDTVRVNLEAGDPYDSVVNDAFLKIIAAISGTEADFSRALWARWIADHAYVIDEQCNEWGDCKAVVRDDVESFFAWWGDLTKSIQDQTGDDFGLRARLAAAKKSVEEKAEAQNNENFFKR
jgi:hypothetical protein